MVLTWLFAAWILWAAKTLSAALPFVDHIICSQPRRASVLPSILGMPCSAASVADSAASAGSSEGLVRFPWVWHHTCVPASLGKYPRSIQRDAPFWIQFVDKTPVLLWKTQYPEHEAHAWPVLPCSWSLLVARLAERTTTLQLAHRRSEVSAWSLFPRRLSRTVRLRSLAINRLANF